MKKILLILSMIIFISCDEKLGIEKEYTVKNKVINSKRIEENVWEYKKKSYTLTSSFLLLFNNLFHNHLSFLQVKILLLF